MRTIASWRPPRPREAYDKIVEGWGEERVMPLFVDNPQGVLLVRCHPPAPSRARA